jgi:hypothetical protein
VKQLQTRPAVASKQYIITPTAQMHIKQHPSVRLIIND